MLNKPSSFSTLSWGMGFHCLCTIICLNTYSSLNWFFFFTYTWMIITLTQTQNWRERGREKEREKELEGATNLLGFWQWERSWQFNLPKQLYYGWWWWEALLQKWHLASVSSPKSRKMSQTTVLLTLYKPDGPNDMRTPGNILLLVVNTP